MLEHLHERMTGTSAMEWEKVSAALRAVENKVRRRTNVSVERDVNLLRERAPSARDSDLENLREVRREADCLRRRLDAASRQNVQAVAQKDGMIMTLTEELKNGDAVRRKMHNTVQVRSGCRLLRVAAARFWNGTLPTESIVMCLQSLRGNVRVFARTRPFLPSDRCDPAEAVPTISCGSDGQSLELRRPGTAAALAPAPLDFTFDKVFAPSTGQAAMLDDVTDFVQSSLDDYRVGLFAYGQTGSGKTHTVSGIKVVLADGFAVS
ncbi:hypothetical protein BBJ28_00003072 [Nothophytophthora sp. Chile5]|nr:hypothetical protein BBJ28_00003072 [Nothophytophthora sp. Chile5]